LGDIDREENGGRRDSLHYLSFQYCPSLKAARHSRREKGSHAEENKPFLGQFEPRNPGLRQTCTERAPKHSCHQCALSANGRGSIEKVPVHDGQCGLEKKRRNHGQGTRRPRKPIGPKLKGGLGKTDWNRFHKTSLPFVLSSRKPLRKIPYFLHLSPLKHNKSDSHVIQHPTAEPLLFSPNQASPKPRISLVSSPALWWMMIPGSVSHTDLNIG